MKYVDYWTQEEDVPELTAAELTRAESELHRTQLDGHEVDAPRRDLTLSGAALNAQALRDSASADQLALKHGPRGYLEWLGLVEVEVSTQELDRKTRKIRFLTPEQMRDLPPPEFLFEDYIVAGGINHLSGAGGSFKSFFAIHIAGSLAAEGKRVMVMVNEGQRGAFPRLSAWAAHHGVEVPPVWFAPDSFQLVDDAQEIVDAIRDTTGGHADLVVIDTLRKSTAGLSEDSSDDWTLVIQAVDYVVKETGAAVLLIDHTGHEAKRARGTSAKRDTADAALLMNRSEGSMTVAIRCLKMKESAEWGDRHWRLVPATEAGGHVLIPAGDFVPAASENHGARLRKAFGEREFTTDEAAEELGRSERQTRDVLNQIAELVEAGKGGRLSRWKLR